MLLFLNAPTSYRRTENIVRYTTSVSIDSHLNINHCPGVQSFLSKKGRFSNSDPSAFRASLFVLCAPDIKVTQRAIITGYVPVYSAVHLARLSLGYCAFHRARSSLTHTGPRQGRYYCDDDSNDEDDRMMTSTWSMTNFRFFDLATLKPCGQ